MMIATEPVRLRRATEADAEVIREWRNDPATRAMSIDQDPVPLPQHLAWFHRALEDPHRVLLIAEQEGTPVGMCRFDVAEDGAQAEVSINLAPERRGRGLGSAVLSGALRALVETGSGIRRVTAVIRPENVASVRLFESLGFVRVSDARADLLRYELGTPG